MRVRVSAHWKTIGAAPRAHAGMREKVYTGELGHIDVDMVCARRSDMACFPEQFLQPAKKSDM